MELKCSLHIHTTEEPKHHLYYNAKQLIDKAANLKFDVLAFTAHDFVFFPKNIIKYAKQKGILLIPGIEKKIEKKHVLIINATPETEKINNFDQLKNYKDKNPYCYIIAAHPLYPGSTNYKKLLEKHIKCFDAIELCHYHTKNIFNKYNLKTEKIAKKYGKKMLATSDVHIFNQLNHSYIILHSKKSPQNILKALKTGKFRNIQKPLSLIDFFIVSFGIFIITEAPSIIKQIYYWLFPKRRKKGIIYRQNIKNYFKNFTKIEKNKNEKFSQTNKEKREKKSGKNSVS